uniref:Uncharacterized protein n=1 Tax=Fagus sylvatica TaxID=28930 RepID=A0A2N9EY37_FAGSY
MLSSEQSALLSISETWGSFEVLRVILGKDDGWKKGKETKKEAIRFVRWRVGFVKACNGTLVHIFSLLSLLAVTNRIGNAMESPSSMIGIDAQFFNHGASMYFFSGGGVIVRVLGWWQLLFFFFGRWWWYWLGDVLAYFSSSSSISAGRDDISDFSSISTITSFTPRKVLRQIIPACHQGPSHLLRYCLRSSSAYQSSSDGSYGWQLSLEWLCPRAPEWYSHTSPIDGPGGASSGAMCPWSFKNAPLLQSGSHRIGYNSVKGMGSGVNCLGSLLASLLSLAWFPTWPCQHLAVLGPELELESELESGVGLGLYRLHGESRESLSWPSIAPSQSSTRPLPFSSILDPLPYRYQVDKELQIGRARSGRLLSPPLSILPKSLTALLFHPLEIDRSDAIWELKLNGSLSAYGAIFRQYICRWIIGSPLPLYFSNSGALNLDGTVMLGNQDMLEKSVFPKEFKPCMSLIFSSKVSILLSNWESFPFGFGGVGGGGVVLALECPSGSSSLVFLLSSFFWFSSSEFRLAISCTKLRSSSNFRQEQPSGSPARWVGCSLSWPLPEPSQEPMIMPILPSRRKLKGIGSPGNHLHASLDLHRCGGREVDSRIPYPRYKGFVVEPVPARPPPESRFDPKVQ